VLSPWIGSRHAPHIGPQGKRTTPIKDSGLGYKEGVIEAMNNYTNVKTFSLPW
jgi:hypothetical protein